MKKSVFRQRNEELKEEVVVEKEVKSVMVKPKKEKRGK